MLKKLFFILVVFLFSSITLSYSHTTLVPIESFYWYDQDMPLNAEVKEIKQTNSAIVYEVFYDSVNNVRLSGVLVIPKKGKKPYPLILYLHGYGMEREVPEMGIEFVLQKGNYAIFSISAQYLNERKKEGKDIFMPYLIESRNAVIQTILDYRRGLDYLETRDDLDTKKIGLLGLSLGSIIGSTLMSVDNRIKCAIFAVGGADFEVFVKKSMIFGPALKSKNKISLEDVLKKLAPIDPINFAKSIKGRPVLMVNGRKDEIVPPDSSKALYAELSEPKHIEWFAGGHVPSMSTIMSLMNKLFVWFDKYLIPENKVVQNNSGPEISNITVKAPDKLHQGESLRVEVKASDLDKNIVFVKAYFDADDSEILLYDDGNPKNFDKVAGDGIYSGKKVLSSECYIGESKIKAFAVDYNGETSKEITTTIEVLARIIPADSFPPEITKVIVPEKIKFGQKAKLQVWTQDKNSDLESVEVTVDEFGISVELVRNNVDLNLFEYELEIPDLIPAGIYHLTLVAKDKTKLKSKKITKELILEK